jgi:hypothetical protein
MVGFEMYTLVRGISNVYPHHREHDGNSPVGMVAFEMMV